MESSTVLAFRIFVMLACLIIVPLAAIFGSAFPDLVKTQLVDRIVDWSQGKPHEPQAKTPDPGFRDLTQGATWPDSRAAGEAPRWGQPETVPRDPWPNADPRAPVVVPVGGAAPLLPPDATANRIAATGAPVGGSVYEGSWPAGNPPANPLPPQTPLNQLPTGNPPGNFPNNVPTNPPVNFPHNQPQATPTGDFYFPAPQSPPANPQGRPALGGSDADRFKAMEKKLRELGATYYLLESWGQQGDEYRFYCRMAVGNNPANTRNFQATDKDALKAMSQVLEQAEEWRSGRRL